MTASWPYHIKFRPRWWRCNYIKCNALFPATKIHSGGSQCFCGWHYWYVGYCCHALEIWQRRLYGPLSKGDWKLASWSKCIFFHLKILTAWCTRILKMIFQGAGNVEKCEQIADVDPYVVSKNLGIYANSVRSYGRHKALNVYISAPPRNLIKNHKSSLAHLEKRSTFIG